jgi:glycosyltransferase involved in cell wall biosynthesis
LIEAFVQLKDLQPQPYLLIVGDGAESDALKQMAANLTDGQPGRIVFAGFRSQAEIARLYDLCDVFCLPSVHEPWGLAVNEAMACSRPVVVSDEVGCQPDLVRDGETGLVFRARDTAALAACLRRLLAEPLLAERLALAGHRHIQQWSFDADVRGLWAAIRAMGVQGRRAI